MASVDRIAKLGAELEIVGIPQADGAPPMTTTYLHVRQKQDGSLGTAVLGLPAYKGDQGDPGPAGTIHQGERDTDELDALATVLGKQHTGYSYRNTDTNDQHVWSGETWIIYHEVYATPGPVGPAPEMVPGTLTIDGETVDDPAFGVHVGGSDGTYSVGIDLPPSPQGERGPRGPAGPIYTSDDVDQSSPRNDGDTLVYHAGSGLLRWQPSLYGIEEYCVPPEEFPEASNISSSRYEFFSVVIPAKDYPYRVDISGGVDLNLPFGNHVDVEVRQGNPENGRLVGIARDDSAQGWSRKTFISFSDQAFEPGSSGGGVVQPGTEVTLYVAAVRKQSSFLSWGVRRDFAQLRVRLMRVM